MLLWEGNAIILFEILHNEVPPKRTCEYPHLSPYDLSDSRLSLLVAHKFVYLLDI